MRPRGIPGPRWPCQMLAVKAPHESRVVPAIRSYDVQVSLVRLHVDGWRHQRRVRVVLHNARSAQGDIPPNRSPMSQAPRGPGPTEPARRWRPWCEKWTPREWVHRQDEELPDSGQEGGGNVLRGEATRQPLSLASFGTSAMTLTHLIHVATHLCTQPSIAEHRNRRKRVTSPTTGAQGPARQDWGSRGDQMHEAPF